METQSLAGGWLAGGWLAGYGIIIWLGTSFGARTARASQLAPRLHAFLRVLGGDRRAREWKERRERRAKREAREARRAGKESEKEGSWVNPGFMAKCGVRGYIRGAWLNTGPHG